MLWITMTRIMSIRLYHIFYVYDYYLIVNAPLLIVPNNDKDIIFVTILSLFLYNDSLTLNLIHLVRIRRTHE